MENFKIDLQATKNSTDGSIRGKIIDFQKHVKTHEGLGLNFYIKSPLVSSCDREVEIHDRHSKKNKKMLMFGSNSYVGATTYKSAIDESINITKKYGVGSGGVPLLSGTTILQNELEKELAHTKGFEDSLLFSSGYAANLGAIVGLVRTNNLLIYDKLNHASLFDGAIMSGAKMTRYLHNNPCSLEKVLEKNHKQYPGGMLVVTDGVFSMDGDITNLPAIIELVRKYDAMLLIDDAHATGVIGQNGAGTLSHFGIKDRDNIIVTGTLSKALGAVGGFITANQYIIDYLRIFARSNMYSTSLPPNVCGSVLQVLKLLKNTDVSSRLQRNANYLRTRLSKIGFNTLNSETPIIPLIVGDEYKLTQMSKDFTDHNIFVNYVFPPVVSPRLSRIRISVMSSHTKEDLDYFIETARKIGKKYDII